MKICDLLDETHIIFDLNPGSKEQVLTDFTMELKNRNLIRDEKAILKELLERESLGSTGLEKGIAVPHAFTEEVQEPFLALGIMRKGTDFEAVDQMPTYVLFFLLGNPAKPGIHLKILAHICRLVKETRFVDKVQKIKNPLEICELLEKEEEKIG
ncbi:PTS sugar transporter subunit IIA [Acidobacteriota bacterium]